MNQKFLGVAWRTWRLKKADGYLGKAEKDKDNDNDKEKGKRN